MFELQVLSSGLNLATNGTASQSSTFKSFSASYAVDGNKSSFSHTGADDAHPWWEVNLGAAHVADAVIISNRHCGANSNDPSGCLCRLSNATLSMTDDQGGVVFTQSMGNTCDLTELSFSIPCTMVSTYLLFSDFKQFANDGHFLPSMFTYRALMHTVLPRS
jgi:hypothetical protein